MFTILSTGKWKKQKNEDVPQPEMESLKQKSDNWGKS